MYYVDNKIRGKQVQQPLFGDFNTAAFVVGVFSSSSSSFDPLAAGEERERGEENWLVVNFQMDENECPPRPKKDGYTIWQIRSLNIAFLPPLPSPPPLSLLWELRANGPLPLLSLMRKYIYIF